MGFSPRNDYTSTSARRRRGNRKLRKSHSAWRLAEDAGQPDAGCKLSPTVLDENGTASDRGLDRVSLMKIRQPGFKPSETAESQERFNTIDDLAAGFEFMDVICGREALDRFEPDANARLISTVLQRNPPDAHTYLINVKLKANDKFDVEVPYIAECTVSNNGGIPGDGRPPQVRIVSVDRDLSDILNPDKIKSE